MSAPLKEAPSSRRSPVCYAAEGGLRVRFRRHAVDRALERGIRTAEVAERLSALRPEDYRGRGRLRFRGPDGLVAVARANAGEWTVITVWNDNNWR